MNEKDCYGYLLIDEKRIDLNPRDRSLIVEDGVKECDIVLKGLKSLQKIHLPASLTEAHFAIEDCQNLKEVGVAKANPIYESIEGRALILKADRRLILGLNYIPEMVARADASAILTSEDADLTLPASLEWIEGDGPLNCRRLIIEGDALINPLFFRGKNLQEVIIKGHPRIEDIGVSYYGPLTRGKLLFSILNKDCPYRYEDGALLEGNRVLVGSFAEDGCPIIPSSAEVIGRGAYAGVECSIISIPDGVKEIESRAFSVKHQATISIGKGLAKIGRNPFRFARSDLLSINVDKDNSCFYSDSNCLIRKEDQAMVLGCPNAKIPEGVKRIASYAFPIPPQEVELPTSLEVVEPYAFKSAPSRYRVTINSRLTAGKRAFGRPVSIALNKGADIPLDFFKSSFRIIHREDVYLSIGNLNIWAKDGRLFNKQGEEIAFPIYGSCPE